MQTSPSKQSIEPPGVLEKILEKIADIAGYISMAAIVYEVVARYVFKSATIWEVEAAIIATIFATFVGAVYALKNNAHITMDDIVLPALKPIVKLWLSVITGFLSFAFLAVLSVKSWQMFWEAYSLGWRSETLWSPPLAIPHSFLAIGASIMSLQYIVIITKAIKSLRKGVDHG